jgi:hypothetical protein
MGKINELVKQITLNIKYKKETIKPLQPIFESFDQVSNIMSFVQDKIYKLGKKFINVNYK